MKPYIALIRRELLEHRGAFLYAPFALLCVFAIFGLAALLFGENDASFMGHTTPLASQMLQMGFGGGFALWTGYLIIALFFYYADSFSADRRNNALLFWKSMPQSDLTILSSKALAGLTIFPMLIFGFAMATGIVTYLFDIAIGFKLPIIGTPNPLEALLLWIETGVAGAVLFLWMILWFAPFLAWVAGLSTLVQRWSIPLAFLIPGAIVIFERIATIGKGPEARIVGPFLAHRIDSGVQEIDAVQTLFRGGPHAALILINQMLLEVRWIEMGIGLIFAAAIVYLASEYRRRRIEA